MGIEHAFSTNHQKGGDFKLSKRRMISSNVGGFCHQTWGLDHGVDTWKMVVSLNKLGKGWEHWERDGSWNEFWVPWGTVYSHNFPYIPHFYQ